MNFNHILIEFFGVSDARCTNEQLFRDMLLQASDACGLRVLQIITHDFSKEASIQQNDKSASDKIISAHQNLQTAGITGIALLAESHISIHSWPEEDGLVAIDIFSCGEGTVFPAIEVFETKLQPKKSKIRKIDRAMGFK